MNLSAKYYDDYGGYNMWDKTEICSNAHKHIQSNEDMFDELFHLLSSARELFTANVINGNMKPELFIKMFCDNHYYIDCDRACCRNAHRMNMGIINGIYTQCYDLFEEYSHKKHFTQKDCSCLVHHYQTEFSSELSDDTHIISFGANFSDKQISCLAGIAHTNSLFLLHDDMDDETAMTSLMACKQGFSVKVRNIRNMAVFFDELLIQNLIIYNWQSSIEKGHFLISPKSNEPIAASSISSALNKAKASSTVTQDNIRKAVQEMQK